MPGRKNRPLKSPRKARAAKRHTPPAPETPEPFVPTVAPPGFGEWSALGTELAAIGPHRILIAMRIARAAATGGVGVSVEEEDQLAAWFAAVVRMAVERAGEHAAAAIWYALIGDYMRAPDRRRPARCPSIGAMSCSPGDRDFVRSLEAAAPGYMRTAIAGASPAEVDTLRAIVRADKRTLDEFRPWGVSLVEGRPAHDDLEAARATLIRRDLPNLAACDGFERWAGGSSDAAAEHDIPPVIRIGAVAWLARVALHEDGIPDPDPGRARRIELLRRHEEVGELDMAGRGGAPREERAA